MKRLNFTLDNSTVELLNNLSQKYFEGNKSQTVRAALESLAAHQGHDGWIIAGYTPLRIDHEVNCHSCGSGHSEGNILFKPVFEKGNSPTAIKTIPSEDWVECPSCVESN